MSSAVLDDLLSEGYNPRLYWPEPEDPNQPVRPPPRLVVNGDAPLPEELRDCVKTSRDALKAALLLKDPPPWLAKLFDLYWSGHQTPVKLTGPTGKPEVYMVSVSIKNIAAAVAAEIGMPVREWERIRPEVEEALGTWKGGAP
jgi:hypothetical protein